jgi:Ca2+-binding EF-hand superfamily protein
MFRCLLVIGLTSAWAVTFLGPDTDHLIDELHNNSAYKTPGAKPKDSLEKTFSSLDINGDGFLNVEELMFRQYATGCEPAEAQVRGMDYMKCGDLNKDKQISLKEFSDSAKPAWAECIKESNVRRAHGFVRFFDADENMDGFLEPKELLVGMIMLWGKPGEELVDPYMKCADKNKDGKIDQTEFHDSIATYNPAKREWEMWTGTSDTGILTCMKPAFAKFDAALVFHATDKNKDDKVSKSEVMRVMSAVNGPSISYKTADDIFKAGDKDKDGYLNLDEFTTTGEAYKGENEAAFFLHGRTLSAAQYNTSWPMDTYEEGYGMSVKCHDRDGNTWRIFSDDLGKVKVSPKKPWTGNVTVTNR